MKEQIELKCQGMITKIVVTVNVHLTTLNNEKSKTQIKNEFLIRHTHLGIWRGLL